MSCVRTIYFWGLYILKYVTVYIEDVFAALEVFY